MSSNQAKSALFTALAQVAKALGHPHRLEILERLAQGERSVDSVAEQVGLTVANASQHLLLMQRAGLLSSRRDGKRRLYGVSDGSVIQLASALGTVAEQRMAVVRD